MAAIFGTSANLVTALTAAAPGPFTTVVIPGGNTIAVNAGAGIAGNNTITVTNNTGTGGTTYLECAGSIASGNGSVLGFGFEFASLPLGTVDIAHFTGTGGISKLQLLSSGVLQYTDGLGTAAAGTTALVTNTRYYVEIQIPNFLFTPSPVTVKVNGSTNVTAEGTQELGYPIHVYLGILGTNPVICAFTFDSLYLLDTTTSVNNTFLGPRVVAYGVGVGTGLDNAWTPSGAATNWQATSNIPPGASYSSDSTPGDAMAVTIGTVAGISTVNFINVEADMEQTVSAGGRSFAAGVNNGTIRSWGATVVPTNGYLTYSQAFSVNPATGNPWVIGDLAALQLAVETIS